ncbi:hypothetical protein DPEC_G00007410 [Dallia pectoralis]|uniref:Uncharacterized protein n=1 Tax=Dallia pectoralis TaxID=75939 RepID=A0ACC2HKR7_DALPE|nr:hypothetical protein DPEC_G00007410 [Dallia pectoralis]
MSPNPTVVSNHTSSPGNSGSQYALCALGVGLVALGIVMIVWSVVPTDSGGSGGGNPKPDNRGRASSVAFVLVGAGVAMLVLSLCLGMRNKQREQRALLEGQTLRAGNVTATEEEAETSEERAQRYNVPSYEEAVGSGQYPIRQSNLRHSTSQLPSYDDLVDGVHIDVEGFDFTAAASTNPASSAAAIAVPPNRRAGRTGLKLLPVKIRRIQSEKLHMNNTDNSQLPEGISIEPLTPPPMYEDKVPQL